MYTTMSYKFEPTTKLIKPKHFLATLKTAVMPEISEEGKF